MAKRNTSTDPAAYGPAAPAVAAGRPGYLIFYREPSEKVTAAFQRVAKRSPAKTVGVAAGVVGTGERREGGKPDTLFFEKLGIVTSTLSDEEHQRLLTKADAEGIRPTFEAR